MSPKMRKVRAITAPGPRIAAARTVGFVPPSPSVVTGTVGVPRLISSAFSISYQNRRPDYLKAWWNVVNWDKVFERYSAAKAGMLTI